VDSTGYKRKIKAMKVTWPSINSITLHRLVRRSEPAVEFVSSTKVRVRVYYCLKKAKCVSYWKEEKHHLIHVLHSRRRWL